MERTFTRGRTHLQAIFVGYKKKVLASTVLEYVDKKIFIHEPRFISIRRSNYFTNLQYRCERIHLICCREGTTGVSEVAKIRKMKGSNLIQAGHLLANAVTPFDSGRPE